MSEPKFDINPVNTVPQVMHDEESGSGHKLLELCLRFGAMMNSVGSETTRTEDSIIRILNAYGVEDASSFTIPTIVIVSFKDQYGNLYTSTRRVRSQSNDFTQLDELNNLSRQLCSGEPKTLSYFESELDRIAALPNKKNLYSILGVVLAAFGFNFIFGGDIYNAIGVLISAFLMAVINNFMVNANINSSFVNLTSSFVGNIFVRLFYLAGLITDSSTASISIIMGLVPGMLLTTSIREIFSKDYTSGLNKLVEGIFVAISLALGSAFALVLTSGF